MHTSETQQQVYFELPESTLNQSVAKVQYPQLNPIISQNGSNDKIDDVSRQTQTQNIFQVDESRTSFLLKYYSIALAQTLGVLAFFLFGLMEWFSSIVVDINPYYYSWEQYDYERQEYITRRSSYLEYSSSLRWTFWFFIVLLGLFSIGLPLFRTNRFVIQHQSKFLILQTSLIGFLIVGISGKERKHRNYKETNLYILFPIIAVAVHHLFQIILLMFNIIQRYNRLLRVSIFFSLTLNFFISLTGTDLTYGYPIVETIIIYLFYYFSQLNQSLLKQPKDLPYVENIYQRVMKFVQERNLNTNIQSLNNEYFIINKKFAISIIGIALYISSIVLLCITGSGIFIFIVSVGSLSILSLLVDSQVASSTLENQDGSLAVCLLYFDIAAPLKNVLRSLAF